MAEQKDGTGSFYLKISPEMIAAFRNCLINEEKSAATLDKYIRDVKKLYTYLDGRFVDKETMISFKEYLVKRYKTGSVNSILAAVNRFLEFLGMKGCRVKQLKVQRKAYCGKERILSRAEYLRLVAAAKQRNDLRLSLLIQTFGGTGIRVSEIAYITVEAIECGEAEVNGKGKTRTVMIPGKLRKELKWYAKKQHITSGCIFRTRSGKPMNRSNIWKAMKQLCKAARVAESKVFPHNLRHLFARTFYNLKKDVVKLADVLGHSQIETTRIYTISTGSEHMKQIEALNLIL